MRGWGIVDFGRHLLGHLTYSGIQSTEALLILAQQSILMSDNRIELVQQIILKCQSGLQFVKALCNTIFRLGAHACVCPPGALFGIMLTRTVKDNTADGQLPEISQSDSVPRRQSSVSVIFIGFQVE